MPNPDKPSVLLVDDNEATRTLITAILQREFSVDVCSDGREAIEKLRTNQYAAMLLDLLMPLYDGFSVLDFLKNTNPEMLPRVLVVTAALSRKETERARSYRICGIINKPFDIDTLLAAVKQCAGNTEGSTLGKVFCSPVILLLADFLRQRLG
jgi:CheY-like chemotaxis protein